MEVPTTIELKVGEVYTLRLSSLGTAGYVWNCVIEGNANLIEVTSGGADVPRQTTEQVVYGASADEQLSISAQEPGRVVLHLTQQRPWETDQPPLKHHIVAVNILPIEKLRS